MTENCTNTKRKHLELNYLLRNNTKLFFSIFFVFKYNMKYFL